MKMTLSYQYLNVNLNILDTLGFPKAQALDILSLKAEDLKASQKRLGVDAFQACLRAAAKYTSNENIGLLLGHKFRVGSFGATGSLYSHCENLEEVMLMNNLYQKISIDAGQVEYRKRDDGSHHMCFRPYYSDVVAYQLLTDVLMASFMTAYSCLLYTSPSPRD